jgi:hypothetical protein
VPLRSRAMRRRPVGAVVSMHFVEAQIYYVATWIEMTIATCFLPAPTGRRDDFDPPR